MDPTHYYLENIDVLVFLNKAKAFERYAEEIGNEGFREYAQVLRDFAKDRISPPLIDDEFD